MQLSFGAVRLLKYILSYTGEKELSAEGKDILSTRRLNSEESAQRRHFFKNVKELEDKNEAELNEIVKVHNEKVEAKRVELKFDHPILEGESDEVYTKRIDILLNSDPKLVESLKTIREQSEKIIQDKLEVVVEPSTLEVIKKYFKEFGEKTGFSSGDDEVVEELIEVLK